MLVALLMLVVLVALVMLVMLVVSGVGMGRLCLGIGGFRCD